MAIVDNHGRKINYVRLAVTDRCNLRCFYCMPEEGIDYMPRKALLSYEEMERILRVLAKLGIEKVRITGGEPFLRKEMMPFLRRVKQIPGIKKLNITTNGTLTAGRVSELVDLGIDTVNLSLDTLDKERFFKITRRDELEKVMRTFHELLEAGVTTKINAVVMDAQNIEDLIPMAMLTKDHEVSVRFIEEMPFNGEGSHYEKLKWNYKAILAHLQSQFPDIYKLPDPPNSTSYQYKIPGHAGEIGIIAAYSRTFCGTCNRLRITPQGLLKTCLYDDGVFNIRDLMRAGASDVQIEETFIQAIGHRAKNGFEAEQNRKFNLPVTESMSTIGG